MDRIPVPSNPKLESLKLFQKAFVTSTHLLGPFMHSKLNDPAINQIACKKSNKETKNTILCFNFNFFFKGGHISHNWNQSCLNSALILFFGSAKKSFSVYASLYIVSMILQCITNYFNLVIHK